MARQRFRLQQYRLLTTLRETFVSFMAVLRVRLEKFTARQGFRLQQYQQLTILPGTFGNLMVLASWYMDDGQTSSSSLMDAASGGRG